MFTLALECSTARGSATLAQGSGSADCELRWRGEFLAGRGHGGELFTTLARAMAEVRRTEDRLGHIVVGLGPGSYSGVRQAIAAAVGLAAATGARLSGLPSTGALPLRTLPCHVVGDARRGTFYYTAVTKLGRCQVGPALLPDLAALQTRLEGEPTWPVVAVETLPPGLRPDVPTLYPHADNLLLAPPADLLPAPLEPIYLRPVTITPPKARAAVPVRNAKTGRRETASTSPFDPAPASDQPSSPPPPPLPPPSSFPTRCWAEIDFAALRHNLGVVREAVGPDTTILAIVKADGYGHGMVPVARALQATGEVTHFGVASLAEALHLRGGLPTAHVTLLSPALAEERAGVVQHGLLPWISSVAEAGDYARHAAVLSPGEPFPVEIKLDTGMGRMGVLEPEFDALLAAVRRLPALRVAGILTHLPSADEDAAFTAAQLARLAALQARLDLPVRFHAQNSAGLLGYARDGRNLVRPGLMLYGSSPLPAFQDRLRGVLTLKTRVTLVRTLPAGHGVSYGRTFVTTEPTRVATLAAGYADGYPRHLSNVGAEVLIRGGRRPLLGRVTMDQVMVDVSALPGVEPGEEVVLLGRQGGEEILAGELAAKSGTIPWEIFTGLTARVARRYLNA